MSSKKIYVSAIILAFASLLSRGLGLLRDHLLARFFGAGGEGINNLDVYYSAFKIPDFIYTVIVYGAITTLLVPIIHEIQKGKTASEVSMSLSVFLSTLFNLMVISVFVLAVVAYVFLPYFTRFLVPGFSGIDVSNYVGMSRILLLSPVILMFSAFFQSVENAYHKITAFALSPVFYNLGIILGIFLFTQSYGVYGIAFGVVIGTILHLLVSILFFRSGRFNYRFSFEIQSKYIRKIFSMYIPRVLALIVLQAGLIFDAIFATYLSRGSLTVMSLVNNVLSLPLGVIGISFSVASFASLSQLGVSAVNGDNEKRLEFVSIVSRSFSDVAFLLLPTMVFLFVNNHDLSDLLFGAGVFDSADLDNVALALRFGLIGIFAQTILPFILRCFYALHNTVLPLLCSFVFLMITILGNYYVVVQLHLGVFAMYTVTGICAIFQCIIMLLLLRYHLKSKNSLVNLSELLCMVVASIFLFCVLQLFISSSIFNSLVVRLFLNLGLTAFIYVFTTYLLKIRQSRQLIDFIRGEIKRFI